MVLNIGFEDDFSSWMVEFKCRCPLVIQYSSYDENMHCTCVLT